MREHINCVVGDDAEVFNTCLLRLQQAMADARLMNLDPEEILVRVCGGQLYQGFAVAKTDLGDNWLVCTKQFVEFEWTARVGHPVYRPKLIERALL